MKDIVQFPMAVKNTFLVVTAIVMSATLVYVMNTKPEPRKQFPTEKLCATPCMNKEQNKMDGCVVDVSDDEQTYELVWVRGVQCGKITPASDSQLP